MHGHLNIKNVFIPYWNVYILHIQYIHTLQVCESISVIVIYSIGDGCQFTILEEVFSPLTHQEVHYFKLEFCVRFAWLFEKRDPGVKRDLPVQYAYCTWHMIGWNAESDDALLLSYTHNCFGLFRPIKLPIACRDSMSLYDQKVFLSCRSLSPSAVADPSSFVRSSSHTSFDTHSLPRRPQKGRVSTLEDDPTKVPLL